MKKSSATRAHNGLLFPDGPTRSKRSPLIIVGLLAVAGLAWFATRSSPAAPPPLVTLAPERPVVASVPRDTSGAQPPRNWEELVAQRSAARRAAEATAPEQPEAIEPEPPRRTERPRRAPARERPVPVPAAAEQPASPAPAAPVSADPGRLTISSTPWGQLVIDGRMYGNTPRIGLPIAVGQRRIRIARDGFAPFDTTITVDPGENIRITGITLREQP